jgi:hypothetical protein
MSMNTFTRRRFLSLITASAASIAVPVWAKPERTIEVWKDPNCGCCKDWIAHLEQNGFRTKVHDTGNHDARAKLGMPDRYASCHTARTDGYLLEGHVPAREIEQLLRERPAALGLAVPAMPIGSPGMDGPAYGGRRDPYNVLLIAKNGSHRIYKEYR